MSKRRTFRPAPAWAMGVPPAGLLAGWMDLGEPLHADGLGVVLIVGAFLALITPALVVSARDVPKLLVPARTRKRWRNYAQLDHWWREATPRQEQKSSRIPKLLYEAALAADRHQCAYPGCGQGFDLEVDHIFPWSLGGLTVLWNLMTLCKYHNQTKSNYWQWRRSGNSVYRPRPGYSNRRLAADILAFELQHRWWPVRWVRAGLALAA